MKLSYPKQHPHSRIELSGAASIGSSTNSEESYLLSSDDERASSRSDRSIFISVDSYTENEKKIIASKAIPLQSIPRESKSRSSIFKKLFRRTKSRPTRSSETYFSVQDEVSVMADTFCDGIHFENVMDAPISELGSITKRQSNANDVLLGIADNDLDLTLSIFYKDDDDSVETEKDNYSLLSRKTVRSDKERMDQKRKKLVEYLNRDKEANFEYPSSSSSSDSRAKSAEGNFSYPDHGGKNVWTRAEVDLSSDEIDFPDGAHSEEMSQLTESLNNSAAVHPLGDVQNINVNGQPARQTGHNETILIHKGTHEKARRTLAASFTLSNQVLEKDENKALSTKLSGPFAVQSQKNDIGLMRIAI